MGDIGQTLLWLSVAVAIYLGFSLRDPDRDVRRLVLLVFGLVSGAVVVLLVALVRDDFSLLYVASYSQTSLPVLYKLTAWWAGQAGSLLFWLWLLVLYMVAFAYTYPQGNVYRYALGVMLGVKLFFALLVINLVSPFITLSRVPVDGVGLNPMLQDPGMVIHPLFLYLGFVGFTIPFALTVAALVNKEFSKDWYRAVRKWSLWAWLMLTMGIIKGGEWAYLELGWGGYWAWDPVENASLIPWLTATAYLHSLMLKEKKGMFRFWTVALIMFTFFLTIFATFLTRSGMFASVHSFAESNLGPVLLAFLGVVLAGIIYLLFESLGFLKDEREIVSYWSKEGMFWLNIFLFVALAVAVMVGTLMPVLGGFFLDEEIVVSVEYFERVSGPLFLAVLLVMGIAPLISWYKGSFENFRAQLLLPTLLGIAAMFVSVFMGLKEIGVIAGIGIAVFALVGILSELVKIGLYRKRATGKVDLSGFWRMLNRNPRRYGGHMVHLGIVIMGLGILASSYFEHEEIYTITVGEEMEIGKYSLLYPGLFEDWRDEVGVVYTDLVVSVDGKDLGILRPSREYHPGWYERNGPTTEIAVYGNVFHDLYVMLAEWEDFGRLATFSLRLNPMVSWIWVGGYFLAIGTLFAFWPRQRSYRRGSLMLSKIDNKEQFFNKTSLCEHCNSKIYSLEQRYCQDCGQLVGGRTL